MARTGTYGYRVEGRGKLEIDGLRETLRDLKKLSDDARDDMKETHRIAGQIVVDGAKRYVPVRSGVLAASMRSAPTTRQGRVRVGNSQAPYAGPIHFGWPARRIKPQPFIYDALDSRRSEVATAYAERITQLIQRHNLAPGQRPTRAG